MSVKASNWVLGIIVIIIIIISLLTASCEKDEINQIVDIDGNVYHSVIIGTQEWMVENLCVTRLNDGSPINLVTLGDEWVNNKSPNYCWYDNIVDLENSNGLLYNFYSVNTGKLAPIGWHVASDVEWKILESFIGMTIEEINMESWRCNGSSSILKSVDNWRITNDEGDYYGFKALPSGARDGYHKGGFFDGADWRRGAYWWTSTPYDNDNGWFRNIVGTDKNVYKGADDQIYRGYVTNQSGFSVRCIKNK